jgi:hypothetical protein
MKRRDFFRPLGIGTALLAVNPRTLLAKPQPVETPKPAGPPDFYRYPPRDSATFKKYLEQDFPQYEFKGTPPITNSPDLICCSRWMAKGPITHGKWAKLRVNVPAWTDESEWLHGINVHSELYAMAREYIFLELFLSKVFDAKLNPPDHPMWYHPPSVVDPKWILVHDSDIAPFYTHRLDATYLPTVEQLRTFHSHTRPRAWFPEEK